MAGKLDRTDDSGLRNGIITLLPDRHAPKLRCSPVLHALHHTGNHWALLPCDRNIQRDSFTAEEGSRRTKIRIPLLPTLQAFPSSSKRLVGVSSICASPVSQYLLVISYRALYMYARYFRTRYPKVHDNEEAMQILVQLIGNDQLQFGRRATQVSIQI
jgi:hypothetical protein